jgi:hypothetical protein
MSNAYSTLANMKAIKRITSSDASDDTVIERLLVAASRVFDAGTGGRTFYPRIETRKFDIPAGRILLLDDDLLALTTFKNGDGTTIASSDYVLEDYNATPYWGIRLREASSVFWQVDSTSSALRVLQVIGEWGFHNAYAGAWLLGSTLNEGAGLNASDLTWTVTSGTPFTIDHIVKIDSEIMNLSGVSTNDLTVVKRGDNGSTAATHANGSSVYIWQPVDDVRQAVEDIVLSLYSKRFGENTTGTAVITGAGVVITPKDITDFARSVIDRYRRGF